MKRLVVTILLASLYFPVSALAQWGAAAAGALSGAADAMQGVGRMMLESSIQEDLMRKQHELEMQRIERQHEMNMEALRNEQRERERLANDQREERERQIAYLNQAHPGWQSLVTTDVFRQWRSRQPESVQQLARSKSAQDASLLLDLFKRDTTQAERMKLEIAKNDTAKHQIRDNWNSLHKGMSKSEVRDLLGEAHRINDINRDFVLWYWDYPNGGSVEFEGGSGLLTSWKEP